MPQRELKIGQNIISSCYQAFPTYLCLDCDLWLGYAFKINEFTVSQYDTVIEKKNVV